MIYVQKICQLGFDKLKANDWLEGFQFARTNNEIVK